MILRLRSTLDVLCSIYTPIPIGSGRPVQKRIPLPIGSGRPVQKQTPLPIGSGRPVQKQTPLPIGSGRPEQKRTPLPIGSGRSTSLTQRILAWRSDAFWARPLSGLGFCPKYHKIFQQLEAERKLKMSSILFDPFQDDEDDLIMPHCLSAMGSTASRDAADHSTEDDDDIVLLTADVLRESRSKDELTDSVDPEDDIILLFAEMRRGHHS
jgi:hypothetical protein